MSFDRRRFLGTLGATALSVPMLQRALLGSARAQTGRARRIIFFYYPDGVAGPSQDGEPSLWHATGSGTSFTLGELMAPLAAHKARLIAFNGLSMGGTDSGSHPGGAKKLLTAVDGGNGASVDQVLARTAGADRPHRHLYLGAMANQNSASGDKHVSYPAAGQSAAPEDDPLRAFQRLFAGGVATGGGGADPAARREVSVIDGMLADLARFRTRLGAVEQRKLDLHLESLREVEQRVRRTAPEAPPPATCAEPRLDARGLAAEHLYQPDRFPDVLAAQLDLMVLAMQCDLTRVGVVQASQHTSELIMSRFPGTEMYDPGFDMRSHQASHYGPRHDRSRREFADYVKQRRWFTAQFAYLLDQLAARPEGDGTMLDYTLAVMCTEVCDGNTHLHDDMPFLVAGGAGGALRTGRLVQGYRRHGQLLAALCHAMGTPVDGFGDAGPGVLTEILAG
jgi:hypothetical protein